MAEKQELIQIHALLEKVSDEIGVETPNYEQLPITSVSIHKSSKAHKNAVESLAEDISSKIE